MDFITSHHPLVRTIVHYYEHCPEELHPVAKVHLDGNLARRNETIRAISPGDYFYFIYRLDAEGIRHDRTLRAVFISAQGGMVLDEDVSEALLTSMTVDGRTLESVPSYTSEFVDAVQERADDVFGGYLKARKRELAKRNDAIVNVRLVSLEQSAAARIARREDQLREARAKNAQLQYVRMLEGALRRLRMDYEQRKAEIERGRALELTFEGVAAGVVRVG